METASQRLHRLTSYEPGRDGDAAPDDPEILQDLQVNDMDRLPWFVKRYPGNLPRIQLPPELPRTPAPAGLTAALAGLSMLRPGNPGVSVGARSWRLGCWQQV